MINTRILEDLQSRYIGRVDRLNHIYGVKNTAIKLAKIYGVDLDQVVRVSYLHDLTKYDPMEHQLRLIEQCYDLSILKDYDSPLHHAFSAAAIAQLNYGVTNQDEIDAIVSHTVGRPNMSLLEKIIFISDFIEPSRLYPSCVKVREIAFNDLDQAVFEAINLSINLYERIGGFIPNIAYQARDYYANIRRKT